MHIEPTSRCTLSCPACPRTWFVDKFNRPFPKQDMDLADLQYFLDCESGKKIDFLILNGNHGDPIYYPDLFNLIEHYRSNKSFVIHTNGSYQNFEFWSKLAELLTPSDVIYFGIDGLAHNNHLYRRNSDWPSIMLGLDLMIAGGVKVIWKTVVFEYNHHEIKDIRQFAEHKGAKFVEVISDRFGDDSLRPRDERYIDTSRLYKNNQNVASIEAQCMERKYISADGFFWPCCVISTMFTLHKTSLWQARERWRIKGKRLDDMLYQLSEWRNAVQNDPEHAPDTCKMVCKPGQKFSLW